MSVYMLSLLSIAQMCLSDLQGRVEAGKLQVFEDCIENMKAQAARIEELEAENEKLRKGFDVYQRERDRYKHATPEMSGAYFLSGGHGPKDDNQMPQFVEIVPAYGCGWSMIYEDTGRSISYEGS